jgi:hypothetical protein
VKNINVDLNDTEDSHECIPQLEGDVILWTCPLCPGFWRKQTLGTGEMVTHHTAKSFRSRHYGQIAIKDVFQ